MRYSYFFFLLFAICTSLFSQDIFEIRGYKWGTQINNIINKEGKPDETLIPPNNALPGYKFLTYYNILVAGYKMSLEYSFFDEKLNSVEYRINDYGKYYNKYKNMYLDLIEKLTKLYGNHFRNTFDDYIHKATITEINKNIDVSYLNSENNNANFFNETSWNKNDTIIGLLISYNKNKNEWLLIITYESPISFNNFLESQKRAKENKASIEGL